MHFLLHRSAIKEKYFAYNFCIASLVLLNAYSYHWKKMDLNTCTKIGLIAQEVQKVFPNLVKTNFNNELCINYSASIPLLITAIKEQQKRIDELNKKVSHLATHHKKA
jgi:hypothetical protein